MDHALPDVKLGHYTGFVEAFGVAQLRIKTS
jgi:hypothetical protein